ncbi:hypothetical protein FBZ93_11148 [Bradyrhizobium macuxiense]|uniref:Uncharacterized protein n=1 Tax=Bradyrhizobium macuxiense TaxID=1755647 RepID=A0A560LCR9_9BRAD|nr:hypothetical protein FBZ93_11148 [Bradyrhizobium macuxiense]
MDFNSIDPANKSPQPDSPQSPADQTGFEQRLSAFQSLAEVPGYDQDLIWRELAPGPSGGAVAGERLLQPSSPQPIAPSQREAPDFGNDPIWQELEPRMLQAGPSQAGPSQPGPSQVGPHRGAVPPELGDFEMGNGRRAWDRWVFTGQTATDAQINMLERNGIMPSKDSPTTSFTMRGVPHTAEWREEGFTYIKPALDPNLWPGGSGEDSPTG